MKVNLRKLLHAIRQAQEAGIHRKRNGCQVFEVYAECWEEIVKAAGANKYWTDKIHRIGKAFDEKRKREKEHLE